MFETVIHSWSSRPAARFMCMVTSVSAKVDGQPSMSGACLLKMGGFACTQISIPKDRLVPRPDPWTDNYYHSEVTSKKEWNFVAVRSR